MIYFIQDADGLVKIGTSVCLSQRLKQLNCEHKQKLKVLSVVDGSYADEAVLHLRFAHNRVLGEWFQPTDELNDFIAKDARPWDGKDEIPDIYIAAKVDRALVNKAKLIAAHRGVSVAELLTDLIQEPLDQSYSQMFQELDGHE
jgi:hypothetical protein